MIEIKCTFEPANSPYWHGKNVSIEGATLMDHVGNWGVVAVNDAEDQDFRLKVWLAPYEVESATAANWIINTVDCAMKHKGSGHYQAKLTEAQMARVLLGHEDAKDITPDASEFLDMCVETRFRADRPGRWGGWLGDPDEFPEWMGDVNWIEITPPYTGGGMHGLVMEAPDIRPTGAVPHMIRINGVWCRLQPLVDTQNSAGMMDWGGRWSITCDPRELDVIRSYTPGDEGDEDLEPEPVPPRWRQAIRRLHRALPSGLPYGVYRSWMKDVKILRDNVMGMAVAQGQVDFYDNKRRGLSMKDEHYRRLVHVRFAKRPPAYTGYTIESWLAEKADSRGVCYNDKGNACFEEAAAASKDANRHRDTISRLRDTYNAALDRCVAREAEYEVAIAGLYRSVI